MDHAYDAVVFADRRGLIRLWNSGAEAMFGYATEEALGQTLDLIIPERFRERHWERYSQVMETGATKYGSADLLAVPALGKDGTRISIEFSLVLISDASGGVLGAAAIIREVTARWRRDKKLREQLVALKVQLKNASDSAGRAGSSG